MRSRKAVILLGAVALALGLALAGVWLWGENTGSAGPPPPGLKGKPAYVGSETCLKCHPTEYNAFKVSGHPYKLMKGSDARWRPLPLPEGLKWRQISYVIGGYKWKARYLDKEGYIITTVGGQPGKNQYNLMTGRWVDYEPGAVKKYDCGKCHTTGYSPEGNQDNKPGIVGTWALDGIQCEACHGPGNDHVESDGDPSKISVDPSAAACGACHVRGDPTKIPAKGGFIEHREQYNELLASAHGPDEGDLSCVDCHSPHEKAEFSIETDCADCHDDVAQEFQGSLMQRWGMTCSDCHMPMASKSAESLGPYKADVKTHLFRINTDPNAPMFTPDGKFVQLDAQGKGSVTLDFACLQCHRDKNKNWAANNTLGIHSLGK